MNLKKSEKNTHIIKGIDKNIFFSRGLSTFEIFLILVFLDTFFKILQKCFYEVIKKKEFL